MLSISNLNVEIAGVPLIRSASLELAADGMCALVGRNGAGKTSLMRTVMGHLSKSSGSVRLNGTELLLLPAHQRAHLGIGYMPEDRRLVPGMTAKANILLPAEATRLGDAGQRLKKIYDLIPELVDLSDRPANALSGGQQKLVALARALIVGDRLLLLDEPTEGVAPSLAKRINQILSNIRRRGAAILVSDSNEKHLRTIVDKTFYIERGVVKEA